MRAAKTVEEATALVCVDFDYVTEVEGFKLSKNVNKLVDALQYWTMKKSRYRNATREPSRAADWENETALQDANALFFRS